MKMAANAFSQPLITGGGGVGPMESDPLASFGSLMNVCIRDDWEKDSMLAATAISFALGVGASVLTAYALTLSHLFV